MVAVSLKKYDLADWVLSRLTDGEKKAVEGRYDDVVKAAELIVDGKFALAQSRYNGGQA